MDSIEEIQNGLQKPLKAIPESDYNNCFEDWKRHRHKKLNGHTLQNVVGVADSISRIKVEVSIVFLSLFMNNKQNPRKAKVFSIFVA